MTDLALPAAAARTRCALLVFLLLASCGEGTETDNPNGEGPLADFEGTACKYKQEDDGEALTEKGTAPARIMAGPEYDGLFCVAWEASETGDLRIELYNHRGGCHVTWAGHASQTKTGVALELERVGCAVAGCGSCIYDLAFDLEGIDASAPLPLAISERSCGGDPDEAIVELDLPLDTEPSGVRCRPQPYATIGLMPLCGRAHLQACGEDEFSAVDCAEPGAAACAEGLRCAAIDDDVNVCLTACETDADCPLAIEACMDGACRLRETL